MKRVIQGKKFLHLSRSEMLTEPARLYLQWLRCVKTRGRSSEPVGGHAEIRTSLGQDSGDRPIPGAHSGSRQGWALVALRAQRSSVPSGSRGNAVAQTKGSAGLICVWVGWAGLHLPGSGLEYGVPCERLGIIYQGHQSFTLQTRRHRLAPTPPF